jgi:Reverse transcriptase (RNA-dependent DNA polymerase)
VENFAPTIWLSVICAIFALVAAEDMECDSLDVTTAFLNGTGGHHLYPSYVDDLHIASKEAIQHVKDDLSKRFKLRDLGQSKWFLGIHITRDRAKRTLTCWMLGLFLLLWSSA